MTPAGCVHSLITPAHITSTAAAAGTGPPGRGFPWGGAGRVSLVGTVTIQYTITTQYKLYHTCNIRTNHVL